MSARPPKRFPCRSNRIASNDQGRLTTPRRIFRTENNADAWVPLAAALGRQCLPRGSHWRARAPASATQSSKESFKALPFCAACILAQKRLQFQRGIAKKRGLSADLRGFRAPFCVIQRTRCEIARTARCEAATKRADDSACRSRSNNTMKSESQAIARHALAPRGPGAGGPRRRRGDFPGRPLLVAPLRGGRLHRRRYLQLLPAAKSHLCPRTRRRPAPRLEQPGGTRLSHRRRKPDGPLLPV